MQENKTALGGLVYPARLRLPCIFHWEWSPAHFTGSGVLHISLGVELAWVEDVLVLCEVAFGVRGVISVNTNITQE